MDDGADIASINVFQCQLANLWGNLFLVDALWDLRALQPSADIMLIPVEKQLLDGFDGFLLIAFALC
ncbi:hypothetical protein ACB268_03735 [Aeromonas sanarellii]